MLCARDTHLSVRPVRVGSSDDSGCASCRANFATNGGDRANLHTNQRLRNYSILSRSPLESYQSGHDAGSTNNTLPPMTLIRRGMAGFALMTVDYDGDPVTSARSALQVGFRRLPTTPDLVGQGSGAACRSQASCSGGESRTARRRRTPTLSCGELPSDNKTFVIHVDEEARGKPHNSWGRSSSNGQGVDHG